jgi:hypothetical protein
VLGIAVAAGAAGCITSVRTPEGGTHLLPTDLVEQISFEHRCSADRIVYLREHTRSDVWIFDLDVCGRVRRYECRRRACGDVTHAFPPDVLPPPVQPPGGAAAAAPERPQGPQRCETSADCLLGVCIEHLCRK